MKYLLVIDTLLSSESTVSRSGKVSASSGWEKCTINTLKKYTRRLIIMCTSPMKKIQGNKIVKSKGKSV